MAKTKKKSDASLDDPPAPPPNRLASVFDDPPRKNVLLLTCMDQRLLDDTVRFMNGLNLQNRYDQVALAGGAMGARLMPKPSKPFEERWEAVYFLHLKEAINTLHRPIKDVFLLEHLDCGAYKYLHPTPQIQTDYQVADRHKMTDFHRYEMNAFAKEVEKFIQKQLHTAEKELDTARQACKCGDEKKCWEKIKDTAEAWADIRISYFVMDLLGVVTQLDVPIGQRSTLKPNVAPA